jgi:excisionase family DNA binding protein
MNNNPQHYISSAEAESVKYDNGREFLTTREAAEMLGLSLGTVQKMVEQGELVAWKTSGGQRRVKYESVARYLRMNCNLSQYDSRNFVSVMQVILSSDTRTQFLQIVNGWGLPVRMHFVEDVFHLLIRLVQVAPDIVILDLDESPCDGLALVHSIKRHESVYSTDLIVATSMSAEKIQSLGGLPSGVLIIGKPVSFELLRGFVSAKLTAKIA